MVTDYEEAFVVNFKKGYDINDHRVFIFRKNRSEYVEEWGITHDVKWDWYVEKVKRPAVFSWGPIQEWGITHNVTWDWYVEKLKRPVVFSWWPIAKEKRHLPMTRGSPIVFQSMIGQCTLILFTISGLAMNMMTVYR